MSDESDERGLAIGAAVPAPDLDAIAAAQAEQQSLAERLAEALAEVARLKGAVPPVFADGVMYSTNTLPLNVLEGWVT